MGPNSVALSGRQNQSGGNAAGQAGGPGAIRQRECQSNGDARVFHLRTNANELRVAMSAGTYSIDMEVWG